MTDLAFADRLFRGFARYIDRPTLALVGSQWALRRLFTMSAVLGSRVPGMATVVRRTDGTLHIRPGGVSRDAPVLYYLHGGGFTIGSPRTHAALVAHLAEAAGMQAVVQRYRLAPEHAFPAAQEDVFAGYTALIEAGTPPVAVCGDSAGGCLSLQLAVHARDNGLPMPKALGLIAPIADLSGKIEDRIARAHDEMLIPPVWAERIRRSYLPGLDPTDPAVSPLMGDLTGLPPTLIQAGSEEALAEDAHRLMEAMDAITLDLWPGLPHVWHIHAGRAPAADRALARMGAWLKEHCK
ncbi:MAG: alpha/beta hydrolase [Pseudomonadota bacterium]